MCQITEIAPGRELAVTGRLDARSAADARTEVLRAVREGEGDLVVHLADAQVHGRFGAGVIVEAWHHSRRHGRRLVVADCTPELRRMLRATRLARALEPAV